MARQHPCSDLPWAPRGRSALTPWPQHQRATLGPKSGWALGSAQLVSPPAGSVPLLRSRGARARAAPRDAGRGRLGLLPPPPPLPPPPSPCWVAICWLCHQLQPRAALSVLSLSPAGQVPGEPHVPVLRRGPSCAHHPPLGQAPDICVRCVPPQGTGAPGLHTGRARLPSGAEAELSPWRGGPRALPCPQIRAFHRLRTGASGSTLCGGGGTRRLEPGRPCPGAGLVRPDRVHAPGGELDAVGPDGLQAQVRAQQQLPYDAAVVLRAAEGQLLVDPLDGFVGCGPETQGPGPGAGGLSTSALRHGPPHRLARPLLPGARAQRSLARPPRLLLGASKVPRAPRWGRSPPPASGSWNGSPGSLCRGTAGVRSSPYWTM